MQIFILSLISLNRVGLFLFSNELQADRDMLFFKLGIRICSPNLGIWYPNRTFINLGHRILSVNKCSLAEGEEIISQCTHWSQLQGWNIRDMLTLYRLGDLGVFRTLRGLEFRSIQFTRSCYNPKRFKHRADLSITRIDNHPRYPQMCYDRGDLVRFGLSRTCRVGSGWSDSGTRFEA
jgi:hypothetical protein